MATIYLTPGATVITGTHHGGLDRMSTGVSILSRLLAATIRELEVWRQVDIEARNAAMLVELGATDPRVVSEVRAAIDRASGV